MLPCQEVSVSRAHAKADVMFCTSCLLCVKHPLRHDSRSMALALAGRQAAVLDNTHPLQQSLVHRRAPNTSMRASAASSCSVSARGTTVRCGAGTVIM